MPRGCHLKSCLPALSVKSNSYRYFVGQLTIDMKSGQDKQYRSWRIMMYVCSKKGEIYRGSKSVSVIVNLKAVKLCPAVSAKHVKYSLNIRSWMEADQWWAITPQISRFCRPNLDRSWTLELLAAFLHWVALLLRKIASLFGCLVGKWHKVMIEEKRMLVQCWHMGTSWSVGGLYVQGN